MVLKAFFFLFYIYIYIERERGYEQYIFIYRREFKVASGFRVKGNYCEILYTLIDD